MADVNIKVKIEAAKAELQLAKLNSQLAITESRERKVAAQAALAEARLARFGEGARKAGRGLSVANIGLASFIGNITSRAVSAGVTTLIRGFSRIVEAGREFEDGLVSVGKTTGISGRQLQRLGNRISDLSRDIPVSTKNLLDLATVAGQLGLKGSDNIAAFTETLGKLQLATDIVGEEGAQSVARVLTVTGELEDNGTENIEKFGNVITRLGNNFAATEAQILRVANRVAQGTAGFGVASEDVLGIAAALRATGSEAEASGTAIQKTFRLIGKAVTEGGQPLKDFADAAGLSTEAFTELFNQDPVKAFEQLAVALGQSGQTGAELNATLERLGLSDERLVRTLNPLISRYTELQRAIADARGEAVQQSALDEEAAKAADTLSADLQQLSNSYDRLSKVIFAKVGPSFRDLTKATTGYIDAVTTLLEQDKLPSLTELIKDLGSVSSGSTVGLAALSGGLLGTIKATKEAQKATNDAESASRKYADALDQVLPDSLQRNYVEVNGLLKEQRDNYVATEERIKSAGAAGLKSSQDILLFEQKKLSSLKKFFNEEEQAKLQSNFAILKSDKEREAFQKFVSQEGAKRQREAFARTIGLDQATLQAAREREQELKRLADERKQRGLAEEQELLSRLQRVQQAQRDALLAEQQNDLLKLEGEIAFEDERFAQLTANLDRRTQAEIAAREANLQDAVEKEALLAEVRKRAADNEIEQRRRAQIQTEALERQKQNATVNFARAGATALFQIAGANSEALFALNKAFAVADVIVRGQQAEALALAQLGPIAGPPVVAGIRTNTGLQVATILATAIGQAASQRFESGGIVGGSSFTGDRVAARVNSGEMILNRQQQTQLFNMANGRGGAGGNQEIVVKSTVMLNEEVVGEAVSRQVANGLVLGEVQ